MAVEGVGGTGGRSSGRKGSRAGGGGAAHRQDAGGGDGDDAGGAAARREHGTEPAGTLQRMASAIAATISASPRNSLSVAGPTSAPSQNRNAALGSLRGSDSSIARLHRRPRAGCYRIGTSVGSLADELLLEAAQPAVDEDAHVGRR